ncbi:ornithine cyclodeaminase family protein [Pseudomonas sp. NPDC089392]|uniref:ornithine cyclodeaminase family protein n=1 Tax=Pseudomonas sp. NPDC089392 TaxID=3364459 RepID=UPI0037F479EC
MHIYTAEDIAAALNWGAVIDALREAHQGPRPQGDSYFIGDAGFGLFSRGVVLPGYGAGLKVCSINPGNSSLVPPRPVEQAAFVVIDEQTKAIAAFMDGPEITRWKTAADSALAALSLSRADSQTLLVIGAGPIAQALTAAYLHIRPSIKRVLLWNRSPEKLVHARRLIGEQVAVEVVSNLDAALEQADIVTCATSSLQPLVKGARIRPGTHVDLVGGFREDMREADDEVLRNARVFVDDYSTAQASGDICGPLKSGALSHIEGDLFDLCAKGATRAAQDRTVYKNAGGAHLDLVVAQLAIRRHRRQTSHLTG